MELKHSDLTIIRIAYQKFVDNVVVRKECNFCTFLKTEYYTREFDKNIPFLCELIKYIATQHYGYNFVNTVKNSMFFEYDIFEIKVDILLFNQYIHINLFFSLKPESIVVGKTVDRYRINAIVGSGTSGILYMCEDEYPNIWAMKLMQSKIELDIEVNALTELQRVDNVIKVQEVFVFNCFGVPFGAYVMPYFKYTLGTIVLNKHVEEYVLLDTFRRILVILNEMHSHGYFHLDIKPANILVDVNFIGTTDIVYEIVPTIADFGLAESLPNGTNHATTTREKFSPWYMCPLNAFANQTDTAYHISWIGELVASCVSILQMCTCSSGKSLKFNTDPRFSVFIHQQYLHPNDSYTIDVKGSQEKIEIACNTAIKDPFFRDLLKEYMNPAAILKWYSELQEHPRNNTVIPEVIAKIETHFRMRQVVFDLNFNESYDETSPHSVSDT